MRPSPPSFPRTHPVKWKLDLLRHELPPPRPRPASLATTRLLSVSVHWNHRHLTLWCLVSPHRMSSRFIHVVAGVRTPFLMLSDPLLCARTLLCLSIQCVRLTPVSAGFPFCLYFLVHFCRHRLAEAQTIQVRILLPSGLRP